MGARVNYGAPHVQCPGEPTDLGKGGAVLMPSARRCVIADGGRPPIVAIPIPHHESSP